MASDSIAASALSPACWDVAITGTGERWVYRDPSVLSQSGEPRPLRTDCRLAIGGIAARRPLPASCDIRRARLGKDDPFQAPQGADRAASPCVSSIPMTRRYWLK